jgi:hypothetical protein
MSHQRQYTLAAIILIFIVPWLIATWLYQHHYTSSPSSQGQLITPPFSMEALQLKPCRNTMDPMPNRWSILYKLPKNCMTECKTRLNEMRQFLLATGKEQRRITLALLSEQPPDQTPYPTWCSQKLDQLPGSLSGIMIADPQNKIVLTYDQSAWQKPALKDLKHLLQWSQLG